MIVNPYAANTIRLARVTAAHPEGQKLEVIFLDTGDYGRDVQVVSPYAGTDFGFTGGIPEPEAQGHDPNMEENDPDKRHIIAVIASLQGMHLCLGYLYPQITQMAFTRELDKNRLIERHTSDFYRSISDRGDMDMVHPSGAYLRVGEGDAPDALDARDYDGRWSIKHNQEKTPSITLALGGSSIKMLPNGDILMHAGNNIEMHAKNSVVVTAPGGIRADTQGQAQITAAAGATITAPLTRAVGNMEITGTIVMGSGGAGGAVGTIYGSLQQISGDFSTDGNLKADQDVTAKTISLTEHAHAYGGGMTDAPAA